MKKSSIYNFQFSILFLVIFLITLLFPLASLARSYTTLDGNIVEYEGLVPCGSCLSLNDPHSMTKTTALHCGFDPADVGVLVDVAYIPCELCHLFIMISEILKFVFLFIVFPIAILLLFVGGFMFLSYAENPQRVEQGKIIITSVVIGLVITLAAWLILNLFFMTIGAADWTGLRDGWFQITCPAIEIP